MKRQNIIIDGLTYIVDLYDAFEDLSKAPSTPHYGNFVMIRNGNLVNDVFTDTDILLIERSIISSCETNSTINLSKLNNIIAFPITGSKQIGYSRKYTDFNSDLNKYNFKVGSLIEKIYDLSDEATAEYNAKYQLNLSDSYYNYGYQAGFQDYQAKQANKFLEFIENNELIEYAAGYLNGYTEVELSEDGEYTDDWVDGYTAGQSDKNNENPNAFGDFILNELNKDYIDGYYSGYEFSEALGIKDIAAEASIPCDRLRIYGPTVKPLINAIFDVEVFINDIRFHVVCQKSSSLKTDSYNEFTVGSFTYSEFIDINIPNINNLLGKGNYYYKDIFNIPGFRKKTILSSIKAETKTTMINEVTKKLHYINGNLANIEDLDYRFEADDETLKRIFGQTNDAEEPTEPTEPTEHTEPTEPTELTTLGEPKSTNIVIDVSPKQKPELIETTKYIINKKSVTTKTVQYDENITILQNFVVKGSGISTEISAIFSNNLMSNKYEVWCVSKNHMPALHGDPINYEQYQILFDNNNPIFGSRVFSKSDNIFKVVIKEDDDTVAEIEVDNSEIQMKDDIVFCSMHLFEMPSIIEQNNDFRMISSINDNISHTSIYSGSGDRYDSIMNGKTYYEEDANGTTPSYAFQSKFIMFPCSTWNEETFRYIKDADPNLDIFSKNYHIKMKNSFEFALDEDHSDTSIDINSQKSQSNKGALVIKTRFDFPDIFENVNEAYLSIMNEIPFNYITEFEDDDFDDNDFPPEIDKCGFTVDIATDKMFQNIVYNDVVNIPIPNENNIVIDEMTYTLSSGNLNVNWKSYPDTLIVKVKYYDKHTGTIIEGNHLVITKEIFKYLINDNVGKRLNINKLKEADMNFIDKINCTIIKNEKNSSSTNDIVKNSPKILYKPIFYKAKDLDQIKLKSGITQNIGLNLSFIMSKVDTFKIQIDGVEYLEVGRNDAYVIFRINTLELKGAAGQYNLLNQDNEYISDGTWYTY